MNQLRESGHVAGFKSPEYLSGATRDDLLGFFGRKPGRFFLRSGCTRVTGR